MQRDELEALGLFGTRQKIDDHLEDLAFDVQTITAFVTRTRSDREDLDAVWSQILLRRFVGRGLPCSLFQEISRDVLSALPFADYLAPLPSVEQVRQADIAFAAELRRKGIIQ